MPGSGQSSGVVLTAATSVGGSGTGGALEFSAGLDRMGRCARTTAAAGGRGRARGPDVALVMSNLGYDRAEREGRCNQRLEEGDAASHRAAEVVMMRATRARSVALIVAAAQAEAQRVRIEARREIQASRR